ncbi:MAG TPA: DUF983 domain-containing protein [Longimicrobium sp.]|nr:DUF983 domain-containing protein [Longimicrobium sp.]
MIENTATMPFTDPAESGVGRGLTLYGRALRLRCPHCGRGSLRGSWLKMRRNCPACGLRSERGEEDFFLGAMMFNLVLAEALVVLAVVGFVLLRWPQVPWDVLGWVGLALAAVAPFLFYPFSHTIWLASDILIRPVTREEMEWHRTHGPDEHRRHRDR